MNAAGGRAEPLNALRFLGTRIAGIVPVLLIVAVITDAVFSPLPADRARLSCGRTIRPHFIARKAPDSAPQSGTFRVMNACAAIARQVAGGGGQATSQATPSWSRSSPLFRLYSAEECATRPESGT